MSDAIGAVNSAESIRTDYLNLLITQLQNQDPLDPLDNSEMASQLAMLSQLEQLENQSAQLETIGGGFQQVLDAQQRAQAAALLGKQVTFTVADESGATRDVTGRVEEVAVSDGRALVRVGEYAVDPAGIWSITE